MPKQKTNSAAKKRFIVKKSGVIKRSKQGRRHILTKKTTGTKRNKSFYNGIKNRKRLVFCRRSIGCDGGFGRF